MAEPAAARLLVAFQSGIDPGQLAVTDLPYPGITAEAQLLSRWNPTPTYGWSAGEFEEAMVHEAGHALPLVFANGGVHAPDGADSCMTAVLNREATKPTADDVALLSSIYPYPELSATGAPRFVVGPDGVATVTIKAPPGLYVFRYFIFGVPGT